ncbi:MAG TPA: serine hydrolase [Phenylobacterium sp.]|nr:serine hydrolase [Phenylobacterium sp.]
MEPSAQASDWGAVRPRPLALRAVSSVFWGVSDAAWAAGVGASQARRDLGRWLADRPRAISHGIRQVPDRVRDGAVAGGLSLFDHRWRIATLSSLLAAAAVLGQLSPQPVHAQATSMPARVMSATLVVQSRKPLVPGPAALQRRLEELAAAYGEPVGVAVADVSEGWVTSVQGDAPFPQQSVSKLWVAITAMQAIDEGRMALDQTVLLTPQDRSVFNQPISYQITETGYATTVRDLLRRALIQSDNAANDKLMSLVGGPDAIRELLHGKALDGIKLAEDEKHLQAHISGLVWTPDLSPYGAFDAARSRLAPEVREAAMQAYLADPYDGATPVGIVSALAALKRGELLSRESTDVILETMAKARTGPRRLKGGLPADWSIAHKTGTGQDYRGSSIGINDVGLITAPDGRTYAVAVMLQRTHKSTPYRLEFMQAVTRAVVETWRGEGRMIADLRPSEPNVAD